MVKEIGGYIEFDECYREEYHKSALALNSGRHCLEYLIRAKNIKKLYIPLFLCASVGELAKKCSCIVEYYDVNENFMPYFYRNLKPQEWLYIVNYYGQLSNADIIGLKEKHQRIIIDNAQAFYQYPVNGVDTLYTCRKYFGVPDGGYLYTDTKLNDDLEIDISYERMKYILGRYEMSAEMFYQDSVENNKVFAKEPLKKMSKLTHNLLKQLDYSLIRVKREENFAVLYKALGKINYLRINFPEAPFMYPLYLENGMKIKKELISRKIYIPTLWPDVFKIAKAEHRARDYTENILPLPCDQRYSQADMEYMADIIFKIINK